MAMKAMLFMLACLLLVTVSVSSEEEIGGEAYAPVPRKPRHRRGHYPHAHEPKPYHHPADAPESHHHHHHHVHHPPAHAPEPYHHHVHHYHAEIPEHHGCTGKCMKYCEEKPKKRWCERVCTECCRKFKCVPLKENLCKAPSWDHVVMYHDKLVKCP